jgi:tungstate transport system permease protein
MGEIGRAFGAALALIGSGDPELYAIIALSLRVSLTAVTIACLVGVPAGLFLAMRPFPGRRVVLVLVNALLGLPPVVVGLIVYLMVSRQGPLGSLGLLFTPAAMILAQFVLTLPIVVALTHRLADPIWREYRDPLSVDGARLATAMRMVAGIAGAGFVTVFLTAFGRAIAEVGAIMVVGGNIRGHTRTMTTAIALETSRGDLALALGLGIILVTLSVAVSALAFVVGRAR